VATITDIQILSRIGAPGPPGSLLAGQLAYNQPEPLNPQVPGDALYIGNGNSVEMLVGAARQVELYGAQTITGTKTIDVADLKITGGENQWLLQTDGLGNISWTNAPGGGLTQVATDGITISGTGVTGDALAVIPHSVAVSIDGVTLSGDGTLAHPLAVVADTVGVAVDGVTLGGNGTTATPLAVVAHSVAIATTGATLTGSGTTASPLAVAPFTVPVSTNSQMTGNGTTGSPLAIVADSVAVATDGITISGTGTTGSPLKAVDGTVAVVTDGVTLGGDGVTASPLHVLPNTVPVATNATLTGNGTTGSPLAVVPDTVAVAVNTTLTGNGTTGSPLGLTVPVSLQNGGTGVSVSSNAALLTALGAAPAASYVPLAGATMTGLLVLSGPATANLNPVSLAQMNSAIAAVPGATYGTTAPTSPVTGSLWFNPTSGDLQIWSGSAWVSMLSTFLTGVTLQHDATGHS
jgi:hypothetical protein